jgi:hypothetical protein
MSRRSSYARQIKRRQKQSISEVYARKNNKLVLYVVFVRKLQYIIRSRKSNEIRVPDL